MATAFPLSTKEESRAIAIPVQGRRVTDDLTIYYLPDGVCDFVVESAETYLVKFDNPEVFGTSFAALRKGNNIFTPFSKYEKRTEIRVYRELMIRPPHGDDVATGPIIIPPKGPGPHFELLMA